MLGFLAHEKVQQIKTSLVIFFFLHFYLYYVCVLKASAATKKKEIEQKEISSKEKRERRERNFFSIFGFQNPSAENLRFPEFERSDHRDIWSAR